MDAEALAAQASAKTLAEERHRQEVAARTAALAAQALAEASANECRHNEVAVHAVALAAQALAAALTEERHRQELAVQALAEASADKSVAMRRPRTLWHWWHRRWPTNTHLRWYAGASDLAVALDAATILARPVQLTRFFPPRGGGLHR